MKKTLWVHWLSFASAEALRTVAYDSSCVCRRQVNEANVLFIDNPVGSGYSYVDETSLLTTDIDQISHDLAQFTRQFMIRHPEFKVVSIKRISLDYSLEYVSDKS